MQPQRFGVMRLVFASNNAHKLSEVRAIMPAGIEILSLRDIGFMSEIEENGRTLEENSLIKAQAVYDYITENGERLVVSGIDGVFADDTGLEIDALDGRPGVYTARWYNMDGEGLTVHSDLEMYAANRAKALRELKDKNNRTCQFRTVITLINNEETIQVDGIVRGRITTEEYGEGGFGYDPIFIPEGYDKTFGELSSEIKNKISHRGRALEKLVELLIR